MAFSCRLCKQSENLLFFDAREMMFGTREVFRYAECPRCEALQIVEIPDLTLYYPPGYYSLSEKSVLGERFLRRLAARQIGYFLLGKRNFPGKLLARLRPEIAEHFPAWLFPLCGQINLGSRILDYGCGNGKLLRDLQIFGFRNLTGADKFIDTETFTKGLVIYRRDLDEFDEGFDLIMLHHSFEHLPDPRFSLTAIRRLLNPGGIALIRMPVLNFAWSKYGTDWVQLDPPRHLFIFSEAGFRRLAAVAGFDVSAVIYDSTEFQFYGSEQYRMDIAQNETRSFRGVSADSIFSQAQIEEWKDEAARLNAAGLGDQACFYLTASPPDSVSHSSTGRTTPGKTPA